MNLKELRDLLNEYDDDFLEKGEIWTKQGTGYFSQAYSVTLDDAGDLVVECIAG